MGWRLSPRPMASDIINHVYAIRPPRKPEGQGSESFLLDGHKEIVEEGSLQKACKISTFPPHPISPSRYPLHLFHLSVSGLHFSYNKPLI